MDGGVGAGGDGGNRNRRRVVPAVGNAGGGETVVGPGVAGDAQPSLAWNGAGYGLAWVGDDAGTSQVFFALVGCPP